MIWPGIVGSVELGSVVTGMVGPVVASFGRELAWCLVVTRFGSA